MSIDSSSPDFVEIPISGGRYTAKVSTCDFEKVNQFNWSRHALGYAFRSFGPRKCRQYQYLHRLIMGEPGHLGQSLVVDHINQDKLDCRRENLRLVSKSINGINGKVSLNNTSGVTGVCWYQAKRKWQARIGDRQLGYFDAFSEAAMVRKRAEREFNVRS